MCLCAVARPRQLMNGEWLDGKGNGCPTKQRKPSCRNDYLELCNQPRNILYEEMMLEKVLPAIKEKHVLARLHSETQESPPK